MVSKFKKLLNSILSACNYNTYLSGRGGMIYQQPYHDLDFHKINELNDQGLSDFESRYYIFSQAQGLEKDRAELLLLSTGCFKRNTGENGLGQVSYQ